jgi:Ca2+-transporting ATPase
MPSIALPDAPVPALASTKNNRVMTDLISSGLSSEEARKRLGTDGPNLIPEVGRRSTRRLLQEIITEPMFLMLLSAGTIYFLIGDPTEGLLLLAAVVVVIAITVIQQFRTERALRALRDLSAPRALVIRNGVPERIAGHEVVRGDLLVLNEGDRIAADATLQSGQIEADESLLTGESTPVAHAASPDRHGATLAAHTTTGSHVFAGTVVTRGSGLARVDATGRHTEMGRIGIDIRTQSTPPSRLQQASRHLVRRLGVFALGLAAIQAAIAVALGASGLAGVLSGITLAMAILPEEIPVVLTVFMAIGASRMAKRAVLTRRISAIETLGSITVLAVDKTGTLTENRMAVRVLSSPSRRWSVSADTNLPADFQSLVETATLATPGLSSDPMERAITSFAGVTGADKGIERLSLVHEYPFVTERLFMARVHATSANREARISAKGAPEAIFDLCRLSDSARADALGKFQSMAGAGLRVLGIACARSQSPADSSAWAVDPAAFTFEYLGLMGFADPPRAGVREALEECNAAGVRMLMLTGDHPDTARAIAQQVGLAAGDGVLSGKDLDSMSDIELHARLKNSPICARVRPAHKLRLVRVLQAGGDIVAMTGDGVNDAPALSAANVGIAMGRRGTDVAREAADLVLLDDGFDRIVDAVRQGRCIFDNIARAVTFIFAVHVPVIALSLIPLLLQWEPLLQPIHIVLFELVIDPACSLVIEAEPADRDVMRRPPRGADVSPFDPALWLPAAAQGAVLAALLVVCAAVLFANGFASEMIRGVVFTSLIASVLLFIPLARHEGVSTKRGNTVLRGLGFCVLLLVSLIFATPWLRGLLGFAALDPSALVALVTITVASALLLKLSSRLAAMTFAKTQRRKTVAKADIDDLDG